MSQGKKALERLSEKTILITGASSGIGEATAFEYLAATDGNVKLILTARRYDNLVQLKKKIEEDYAKSSVHIATLDVTQTETIQPFIDNLPNDFKDIDILVNNAGKALGSEAVGSVKMEDIKGMMDTNVLGLIGMTQAVLPIMKAKDSGDIVNLGSIAGLDPYPTGSIYCATKFAVRAFTHSLRKELINTKIRAFLISPGLVETEFSVVRYKGDQSKANNVYNDLEPLVAGDIADLIVYTTSRRQNTVIADTLIFPSCQASASHIYRGEL